MKGGEGSGKKEDEVFVLETEGYINCVSALLKLIEVCMLSSRTLSVISDIGINI